MNSNKSEIISNTNLIKPDDLLTFFNTISNNNQFTMELSEKNIINIDTA